MSPTIAFVFLALSQGMPEAAEAVAVDVVEPMKEVNIGKLRVKLAPVFSAVTSYKDVPYRASILDEKGEPANESVDFCRHSCAEGDLPVRLEHGGLYWTGIHGNQVFVRHAGEKKPLKLKRVEIRPLVGAITKVYKFSMALPFGTVDAQAVYQEHDFLPLFDRLVVPENADLDQEFVQALAKWERQGGVRMSLEGYQKYRRVTNETIKLALHTYLSRSLVRTMPASWLLVLFLLSGTIGMVCFWRLRTDAKKQMQALVILATASGMMIVLLTYLAFPERSHSIEVVLQHSNDNGTMIVARQTRLARFFGGTYEASAQNEEAFTRPAGRLPACSYEEVPAETVECDLLHSEVSYFTTAVQKVPKIDFDARAVDISPVDDAVAVMRAGSSQGFAWVDGKTTLSTFSESPYDTERSLPMHERQLIESIASQGYNVILARSPEGKLSVWGML